MSRPGEHASELAVSPQGDLRDLMQEAEMRLASLHRVCNALHQRVEATCHAGSVFNLVQIEDRGATIVAMRNLHAELQKLAAIVAKDGIAAEALHRREIHIAHESLSRATGSSDDGQQAGARAVAPQPAKMQEWARISAPKLAPRTPLAPMRCPVHITEGITIDAVVLPKMLRAPSEILASVAPGDIYYIPGWNHFAVRIGSCVLHANVGQVYTGRAGPEGPVRVRECQRPECSGKHCRYYHDPVSFPESSDVRNYVADSWLYAPPASPARYGARRIGSVDHLAIALKTVDAESARRFLHQTAHDIICALILWKYTLSPPNRTK
jgi:hypothetical protein